jgi:hypothetical protein
LRIIRIPAGGAIFIDIAGRPGQVASHEVFVPFSTR